MNNSLLKFINKSNNIHKNQYSYNHVEYKNMKTPVIIKCFEHGKFTQTPSNHLYNEKGCPICDKNKKINITCEKFIKKAKRVHNNNNYDYSLVKYENSNVKVDIICKKHGIFQQTPRAHLSGTKCPKCSTLNINNIISKFIEKHGLLYEYGEHIKNYKIDIFCKKHGKFCQSIYDHMKGSGCPSCDRSKKDDIESFIQKAKKIHKEYDYSKVIYKNSNTKIDIICKKHGIFKQTPSNHILRKNGCPTCAKNKKYTRESFIQKANEIHNHKFNYELLKYINSITKVKIICPKHGIFEQIPSSHLNGCGCKKCADKSIEYNEQIEFLSYRKLVRRYTKRNKNKLYENWDGYDFYDNEYIKEYLNISHIDNKYPTIDHRVSIYYGFLNNISPQEISDLNNLCITKRGLNSKKNIMSDKEFKKNI